MNSHDFVDSRDDRLRLLGRSLGRKIAFGFASTLGVGLFVISISNMSETSARGKSARETHMISAARRTRSGVLVICGGKLTTSIQRRFVALAGGPAARLVIITTGHQTPVGREEPIYEKRWDEFDDDVKSLDFFNARSRAEADDPEIVAPFRNATGVWIEGGKQSIIADRYLGTAVERNLKEILDRGGVVGGHSAGAAVMSKVMISGGRENAGLARGFDLLPGFVIDQHFLKRNRFKRLRGVLKKFPDLVGLGIDEETAVVVENKRMHVIGESYAVACLPDSSPRSGAVEFLKEGDETDLASLRTADKVVITHADNIDALEHITPPIAVAESLIETADQDEEDVEPTPMGERPIVANRQIAEADHRDVSSDHHDPMRVHRDVGATQY
jgi:cyanophycinase